MVELCALFQLGLTAWRVYAAALRPLLKRKCSDLAELWVMLAQLAALVVLMSLFVALLSVGD